MGYYYVVLNKTKAPITVTNDDGDQEIEVGIRKWKTIPVSFLKSAMNQGLTNLGSSNQVNANDIIDWVLGSLMDENG